MRSRLRKAGTAPRRAWVLASLIAAVSVVMIGAVLASGTVWDMTDQPIGNADTTFVNDGGRFEYIVDRSTGDGTGNLHPFIRVQKSGQDLAESGYNSINAEFQTKNDLTHSRVPVKLSEIPVIEVDGIRYLELIGDWNEADSGTAAHLSIDAFELYVFNEATSPQTKTDYPWGLTGYHHVDGDETNNAADEVAWGTPVWYLQGHVKTTEEASSGSGQGDMRMLIPADLFDSYDCQYGDHDNCDEWLIVFVALGYLDGYEAEGDHDDSGDPWGADATFEEISYRIYPVLDVSKTLNVTYEDEVTWDLTKDVTPASQSGFPGDTLNFDYDVDWTKTVEPTNWKASGTITLANNSGEDLYVTELVDELGGLGITISDPACDLSGGDFLVADGATVECDYEESLLGAPTFPLTNTVDVDFATKSEGVYGPTLVRSASATAESASSAGLSESSHPMVVDVDDDNDYAGFDYDWSETGLNTSGNHNGGYTNGYICSTDPGDYTNGFYTYDVNNTATMVETGTANVIDFDSETVTVNCYAPTVSKTADGDYDTRHDWTITKTPDGDYKKFVGETATHGYTVDVDLTETEENFVVTGAISVTNPAGSPGNMIVGLTDQLNTGFNMTITGCVNGTWDGGAETVEVAPGDTAICSLNEEISDDPGTNEAVNENTATIMFSGLTDSDSDPISWTNTDTGNPEIDVTDTNGEAWNDVTVSSSWNYNEDFVCPMDTGSYTNGVYVMDQHENTAEITQTGQYDTATVDLTCYAPTVSKDADGDYDTDHTWTITKDPDGDYDLLAGESVVHEYTVDVDLTETEENFVVTGAISVTNPAGSPGNMVVGLTDELNDLTAMTIQGCTSGTWDGIAETVEVAPGDTAICELDEKISDDPATNEDVTENEATITFNGYTDSATDPITWTNTDIGDPEIDVIDTNGEAWLGVTASSSWDYTRDFACPSDEASYTDGVYVMTQHLNTATIQETGQYDTATVDLICYAPVVDKTAETSWEKAYDWTIDKTLDADGTADDMEPVPTDDYVMLNLNEGGSFLGTYYIDVDSMPFAQNEQVDWTITVENPAPGATGLAMGVILTEDLTLECKIDGGIVLPDGDGVYTIPAGKTMTCTGSENPDFGGPGDLTPIDNTVDVDLVDDQLAVLYATSAMGTATWGGPDAVIDECVVVDDHRSINGAPESGGVLGIVCAEDLPTNPAGWIMEQAGAEFSYEYLFGGIDAACGLTEYYNIATYVAVDDDNDTGETGYDEVLVVLDVFCEGGCTYTIGYWRTHNILFWGGASNKADPNWYDGADGTDGLGDFDGDGISEGPDETLKAYNTKGGTYTHYADVNADGELSFFEVLWAPPKGDGWIILGKQYIGALLNIGSGAAPPPELMGKDPMAEAWKILDNNEPGDLKGKNKKMSTVWAAWLDDYNNGIIGPGHCSDDSD